MRYETQIPLIFIHASFYVIKKSTMICVVPKKKKFLNEIFENFGVNTPFECLHCVNDNGSNGNQNHFCKIHIFRIRLCS